VYFIKKKSAQRTGLTQCNYERAHSAHYRTTEEVVMNLNDKKIEINAIRRDPPPQA
jgi:hypothetical protein